MVEVDSRAGHEGLEIVSSIEHIELSGSDRPQSHWDATGSLCIKPVERYLPRPGP